MHTGPASRVFGKVLDPIHRSWSHAKNAVQMLEQCLELHGVNVKDLQPSPVDMSTELCYSATTSRGPMRTDAQMRRNSGEHVEAPGVLCGRAD